MILLVSGTTKSFTRAAAVRPLAFGRLLTPANRNSIAWVTGDGKPWAVDNGCFHCLDAPAFTRLVGKVAGKLGLLWVAAPDVVGDARTTLERFREWLPMLRAAGVPVALVGQDGTEELELPWDDFACLFIGGTTRWKLSQASADLGFEAKRRGKMLHFGRVNSRRRLRAAFERGCDSVDGTGMSRWGDVHLLKFARWLAQIEAEPTLF